MVGTSVKRRYANVDGRIVHYRRAGSGPPVVLVHASPQSSRSLLPLIEYLAPHFTVFALDTPGFGYSDPLDKRTPTAADFADALAEVLRWLRIPRCAVFGAATGACIALELGRRHPKQVTGLTLENVPIFDGKEAADNIANYQPRFRPQWDGRHLVQAWTRMRDHVTWFPWFRRQADAISPQPFSTPEQLHSRVLDFLLAGDNYRHGYHAAFSLKAVPAARTLKVPATFFAMEGGPLRPHLDKLPKRANIDIKVQGLDRVGYFEDFKACLERHARGKAPRDPDVVDIPGRITSLYVDIPGGQLRVRRLTTATGRPLVMLHDGPGTGLRLEPLMRELARERPVYAIDMPGNGDSDPLSKTRPAVPDYAASIGRALTRLGLKRVDLYGKGSGASVATEFAVHSPRRLNRLILHGVMMFGARMSLDLAAHYTPELVPTWDGAYLYRTWLMVRDQQIFWPWYRRGPDPAFRVGITEDFRANWLNDQVIEILKCNRTYHLTLQAAFRYPMRKKLPQIGVPTLVCSEPGEPLHSTSDKAVRLIPNGTCASMGRGNAAKRRAMTAFLGAA